MVCSNCYSGCTQITSDKCVKYTGLPNTVLGIKNGDSLNYTTAAIMGFLTTALDGTGIKYEIAAEDMCTISSKHIEDCTDVTVIAITTALSKAICEIDGYVTTLQSFQASLESDYVIPTCITVDVGAGTHAVLNATMTQVCTNTSAITATNLDLSTNYVAIADIDQYIADYIDNQTGGGETGYASNMVPFTVVEYYGSLTNFDATGAGTGAWANIYLCNGNNNTPDKRGRVGIGTTSGMGGGTMDSAIDPSNTGNPAYSLLSKGGANTVNLSTAQLPSHTHTGTTNTDGAHSHIIEDTMIPYVGTDELTDIDNTPGSFGSSSTTVGGTHSHEFTTNATGGGEGHANIQPVIACHYIMYIPS